MKTKPLTFLLALTFLFLFSGSVFADDLKDAMAAHKSKDYKEAVRLYRLSAKQGNAEAQYSLGLMYDKGQGVPQDYKEAARLYRLSAKQGNPGALTWYRLSAKQGNAEAQYNLGLMYEKGQVVPKDFKEAFKWSKLAADQGNASTQNNLSYMYYKGQGVPKDYVLAHMWWNIASSNGHNGDIKFRDIIEKRMSPSQLKKAQEMARNWKPKK